MGCCNICKLLLKRQQPKLLKIRKVVRLGTTDVVGSLNGSKIVLLTDLLENSAGVLLGVLFLYA